MPLQATSGAASYDAFGGGVVAEPNYIESCFSTFLYAGNDSTQSITNNIDISTKGALVWVKGRSGTYGTFNHTLITTPISNTTALSSNTTGDGFGIGASAFSPTTTGFNLNTASASLNNNGTTYVSWTFRKQPKFFDVVTWTGTGSAQTISHNLGSTPGCIIVKRTSGTQGWIVYHRSLTSDQYFLQLNLTDAQDNSGQSWAVTDTTFNANSNVGINASGQTFVAYLFAHNAGGFGLTGTDNVISCGSYTGTGSTGNTVTLGYEPQWIIVKRTDAGSSEQWTMWDIMRGWSLPSGQCLFPNLSNAEVTRTTTAYLNPIATGFTLVGSDAQNNASGGTYIYIAIRRGPMKTPTVGTSVFAPVLNTGTGANINISSGSFAPDMLWNKTTDHAYGTEVWDKLRGVRAVGLTTSSTAVEGLSPAGYDLVSFNNTGVTEGSNSGSVMNISTWLYVNYMFGRAPGFFDVVCYTGTEVSGQTFTHNLGAVPEMMIVKSRNGSTDWTVYHSALGASARIYLNATNAANTGTAAPWNSTTPTSSVFSLGNAGATNLSGGTFVNYLFATVAGVSKVGSYTGNGTTQTINCGFTGGARFVMVKATSTTGNWIVADSARGIVAGNDPALYLNSTAAEVTGLDWIDADNSGFVVNETATIAANTNGVSYIFLAIA